MDDNDCPVYGKSVRDRVLDSTNRDGVDRLRRPTHDRDSAKDVRQVHEQRAQLAAGLHRGNSMRPSDPLSGSLSGFVATSAETAFYVGSRSSLTATYNGGRGWRTEPGFSGSASGTAQVVFVGQSDGWAIDEGLGGHAVLWRTRDRRSGSQLQPTSTPMDRRRSSSRGQMAAGDTILTSAPSSPGLLCPW